MMSPTRKKRAGWNRVERLIEDKALLMARFDAPGQGHELEGSPCVGDSGGPALIPEQEGEDVHWRIAGVIALVDDVDDDRVIGIYGDEFGLTRVSAYQDWIYGELER